MTKQFPCSYPKGVNHSVSRVNQVVNGIKINPSGVFRYNAMDKPGYENGIYLTPGFKTASNSRNRAKKASAPRAIYKPVLYSVYKVAPSVDRLDSNGKPILLAFWETASACGGRIKGVTPIDQLEAYEEQDFEG